MLGTVGTRYNSFGHVVDAEGSIRRARDQAFAVIVQLDIVDRVAVLRFNARHGCLTCMLMLLGERLNVLYRKLLVHCRTVHVVSEWYRSSMKMLRSSTIEFRGMIPLS